MDTGWIRLSGINAHPKMIQVHGAPSAKTQVRLIWTDNKTSFWRNSKSEGNDNEISQIEDHSGASSNMYFQNFPQPRLRK